MTAVWENFTRKETFQSMSIALLLSSPKIPLSWVDNDYLFYFTSKETTVESHDLPKVLQASQ